MQRSFHPGHDPFQIAGRPDGGVWEYVVERTKNCLGLVGRQLVDRQPKSRDAAVLQAVVHKREKLLSVEINRSRYFQRRGFSGDNVVALGTGLQEEAAI